MRVAIAPEDRTRYDYLYALIGQIPGDASVAAAEMLVAHVSSRKNAYTLMHGHFDADYLLTRSPPAGQDRERLIAALRSGAYGLVAERGEREKGAFALFRRGAPAATAQAYLRSINVEP